MNLPTGTITFLFTDIEGSTALWEAYPDAMRIAVARHDALLRQVVEENNGYLFKTTGDGIAAAFATAPEAVATALAAQMALRLESWPDTAVIYSRMGLHTGAAELRDGDYFGPTLNRTARLMAAGHGGQILLSEATQELSRDILPRDTLLRALGEHRLKDLTRPETVYQLAHPAALRESFPPLRTLDNPALPNNLPRQLTSFIGREKDIASVKLLLQKTSLLTLTGAGGSGKTRLGLQIAADVLDEYPDGIWLVELASLSDPSLVPQTVAAALGVREQPGQSVLQTLIEQLKSKRLLLLLDNCEHLITACTQLAATLLRACPNVKVLATSREPLGISGETTYRVPSLSLPSTKQAGVATADSLSQFEAVRLFIERAQSVKQDFAVTNANAPSLAQLCYRLDGIPLAIELAAARIRSLPVEQINDRLDSRFRLLTGGDRSALPRQQTLRALIDWSYDLLTQAERALLARVSVFAGGWTLSAAEMVCSAETVEDWEVLDLLTSLTDKSLILVEEKNQATRYWMQETIRQYAQERLLASGEHTAIQLRHRDWCVALAEEAEPQLTGSDQAAWFDRLETEHDNMRASLAGCSVKIPTGDSVDGREVASAALAGVRLSGALWRFWWVRGYVSEGREYLGQTLSARQDALREGHTQDAAIMAKKSVAGALRGAGILAWSHGDNAAATAFYQESLMLRREISDKTGIASTLNSLGLVASDQGDYAAAQVQLEESLSLFREMNEKRGIATTLMNLGNIACKKSNYTAARLQHEESLKVFREISDKNGIGNSLTNLGNVAYNQNDYSEARTLYEQSLALYRETGDKRGVANSLNSLGSVDYHQGDYVATRVLYRESISLFHEIGHKRGIAYGLESIATVRNDEGDRRAAVALWAAAQSLRESIGSPLSSMDQAELDQTLAEAREALGDDAFAAAWAEGAALTWEQAIGLAQREM